MSKNKLTSLIEGLLIDYHDDYIGLWSIVRDVRDIFPNSDPTTVQEITLKVVRDLLEKKMVEAGFPTRDGGFDTWSFSLEETLSRIKTEWDQLGRDPNIGEIVWFNETKKGEMHAKKLMETKRSRL